MKYLKLFEEEVLLNDKITKICKEYNIKNYVVNPDGSIDVDGNVNLLNEKLTKLPFKFNKINGYFVCSRNRLTSLEGAPIKLDNRFSCSWNYLTSLEGSPKEVNGDFYCSNNQLISFEFSPKIIRGEFDCRWNNIKSFEYFPRFVNYLDCIYNPIFEVWDLFRDTTKIELLNDFDIFRDEDTDSPGIVMDRLNDFLLTIDKPTVKYVFVYKNI